MPHYDDFFDNLRTSALDPSIAPLLLFETSRGIWWGAKSHCTFCGLNAQGMGFRSKSGERVVEQLTQLAEQHPGTSVSIVDNILDMKYFRDVVPRLAELDLWPRPVLRGQSQPTQGATRRTPRGRHPGIQPQSSSAARCSS